MSTKPSTYLNWTDGNASKVTQPPTPQQLSGWTAGEPIPFQYLNWLFYETDQWIQWFDYITESSNKVALETASFTAAYPATIYLCAPASSNINATLPAASSGKQVFEFKNTAYSGSNTTTVVPNGTDTIENANSSAVLKPGDSLRIVSDGVSGWWQMP